MPAEPSAAGRGRLAAFVRLYSAAFLGLAAVAMAAIVLIMSVQIFFRYALNDSLIWAEEMCRYLLIAITFLLIGIAYQRGEMVNVQFFIGRLPPQVARGALVPVYLIIIAFLGVISFYGYRYATFNSNFSMPAVDFILSSIVGHEVSNAMSMYWVYMLIPAGCLILAVHFTATLVRTVAAIVSGGGRA